MCSKSVSSPEFRIICEEEGRVFDGEMIPSTFQNQFGSDQRQIWIIFAYKQGKNLSIWRENVFWKKPRSLNIDLTMTCQFKDGNGNFQDYENFGTTFLKPDCLKPLRFASFRSQTY